MKTRRDFLAALGFGAGASILGLPETARAWGGRWRRPQPVANECACEGTQHPDRMTPYFPPTPIPDCMCVCPQSLLFQVGKTYYYACLCCDFAVPYPINGTSSVLISGLPIPCKSASCIGGCANASPSSNSRIYLQASSSDGCGFHLDPDDVDIKGNVHAKSFIEGIDAVAADALNDEIYGHPNVKSGKTLVTRQPRVVYDNGARYVALYDAIWNDPPNKSCTLHVGFEVLKDASITAEPDEWGIPFNKRLKHYHRLYMKGFTYHVNTAKKK